MEADTATPGSISEYRLSLRAAGFSPIPVMGKKPVMNEWQTMGNASAEEVAAMPVCTGTAILTELTPALDIDIKQADAADAVAELALEWFGDSGKLLTRFGEAPKRAILFRTDQPFKKHLINFTAQNGFGHKIEVLGSGQQIVIAGIHPDTKKPYSWHGGYEPGAAIPRADLPEIDEELAVMFLNAAAEMLAERFGFQEHHTSGAVDAEDGHGDAEWRERVDVDAELAGIIDGATANSAQTRVIPSLQRRGEHPDDILELVVDATMKAADSSGLGWTRNKEIFEVRKRVLAGYKLLLKDYDHTTGVIPTWLPGEFHEAWIDKLQRSECPVFRFNRGGFHIQAEHKATNHDNATGHHNNEESQASSGKPETEKPNHGRRVLELRPFVPFDVAALPPRSWLYAKHYQRRTVSLTAGPGGMGKSSLTMVEAVAMCTARNLLGEQPEERLRVWLHNGEDPLDEIHRRLAAICQHYKISQAELQGYLWVTSGNEFPLRVAKGYSSLDIDSVLLRQISNAIGDNGIDLASFDPLVTLHSVSEMDTGKMDTVIRLFSGVADETDTGIELAHHVRKPMAGAPADFDVHDIRGVMAITDAARAVRVLNRMNEKDAEAAGCSEPERLSRFRVDRAKGNYSKGDAATWRQFVSVDLPNGDSVGVVAQWNYPGQGEQTPEKAAADERAEQTFLQLLDKFTARNTNVSANSGPTYAPAKFADEREAKTAKVSKAALKAAMGRLLDSGRIRAEPFGRDGRGSHRLVAWHGDVK
jgi:RecA-family ATPase